MPVARLPKLHAIPNSHTLIWSLIFFLLEPFCFFLFQTQATFAPSFLSSLRINRDKEGLRKQRPHATVASPPSVRPRDVRRLLELLLHLAAIGGALQRQSIAKGLERADERQCPG